jgi:hypothetical protein
MVAWLKQAIFPGRGVTSRSNLLEYIKEESGQSFIQGAALVFTAGTASECANDPATVDGFARKDASDLAADSSFPDLPYIPIRVGERYIGSLKEALSTVAAGNTTVGLLLEGDDWVFSTSVVNKKFKIKFVDPRAADADTYAPVEVEYTG